MSPHELETHTQTINMQTWFGLVIVLGRGDGTLLELDNPRPLAFLFSTIKGILDFVIVGEKNPDNILHFHCLVKSLMRSDSLQRSLQLKWEQVRLSAMEDIEEPEPTLEICKCQKAHRPGSLGGYMVKNPLWICANKDITLQYMCSLWYHRKGDKFLVKQEELQKRKQRLPTEVLQGGHGITRDILNIIFKYNCKTAEDIFKHDPEIIVQHLHKPGFSNILKNCLSFVEATKGEWSFEKNAKKYEANPRAIHMCLAHQGVDIEQTDLIIYNWLSQADPKRNTILIIGPSNTGKSAFIRGLKGVMESGEICNGQVFMFEGLVGDKKLGIWEEPLISPEAAEKTKQVLEGMETTVPVKYKKPQRLNRTPIIITSNHWPWRYCTAEEGPFRNRMWILPWEHSCDPPIFTPRSSHPSCQCSCCTRCRGSPVPVDLRTTSGLSGGEQPIQPVGRGDQPGRELGTGCTGPVQTTMDRSDGSLPGTSACGAAASGGHDRFSTSSADRGEEQRSYRAGSSSSSGAATGDSGGSSGYHGSGHTVVGVYGAGRGDGMSMESLVYPSSDGSDSDGVRSIWVTDQSTSTTDLRNPRGEYDSLQQMVVLVPGEENRDQMETKEPGLGGEVDALEIPNTHDWCCYLSYLYQCFK